MEEAFTFAAAAPFIALVLALVRTVLPELRGRLVPLVAAGLSFAWGGVLVVSDRFTGDPAEFVVAGVIVTAAVIGVGATASTLAPEGSAVRRVT